MNAATATAATVRAIPIVPAGQTAAEEWQTRFAEDAAEPPEPDYKRVAQALASVKDERLACRPDVHAELKAAKEQVTKFGGYRALVKALGIPRTAFIEAGGLGLSRIETEARYFTPAADSDQRNRLALIVPVWDGQGGDLVDLLAVRTDQPSRFIVRSGFARCLGEWNADAIRDETTLWELPGDVHPSLVLSPNPLTWLRGDCRGACILHKAWISHTLVGIRSVTAHNERHAAALHELLTWPGAPEIFFPQKKKREAA